VTSPLKHLLRKVFGPALRWLSGQLAELQRGIDSARSALDVLQAGQQEVIDTNRAVLSQRDVEIEIVGRTLALQRATLESVEAEQRRVQEELRALQLIVQRSTGEQPDPVVDGAGSAPT